MPLIATELDRYSQVVKQELWPETRFCRERVVCNETAITTYAVGTVLGIITASGKYRISVQNAADGSQNPVAVVLEDVTLAANTDATVLVMNRGPAMVSKFGLKLHSSWDQPAELAAAYASLATRGIIALDAV